MTQRKDPDRAAARARDQERQADAARQRAEALTGACLPSDWAEQTIALDAPAGLVAVLGQLVALHNAALDAGEGRTALECVRFAAHLLGYGRQLTDATREAASEDARKARGK